MYFLKGIKCHECGDLSLITSSYTDNGYCTNPELLWDNVTSTVDMCSYDISTDIKGLKFSGFPSLISSICKIV